MGEVDDGPGLHSRAYHMRSMGEVDDGPALIS